MATLEVEATTDSTQADEQVTQSQADAAARSGSDGEDTLSIEDARKLRSEAKALRQRLKAAEGEVEKRKSAEQSDQQRLEGEKGRLSERVTGLEADNRYLRVQLAAHGLGIKDPEAAAKLLDWESVDDPDDRKSLERALRELAKKHSGLLEIASADGGAGRRDATAGDRDDMNTFIRRSAGRV